MSRSPILSELAALIERSGTQINEWLEEKTKQTPVPFYASVDLRHSGSKLAPVDTNLFPAGFNNLSQTSLEKASHLAKRAFTRRFSGAKSLLIIPENHTRNKNYLHNISTLITLLKNADMQVQLGRMEEGIEEPVTLELPDGDLLKSIPIRRQGNDIETIEHFKPDIILVNNDLTAGAPTLLCNITQPVIPPPGMGWYRRRKSEHFRAYAAIAEAFCQEFSLDSWKINALSAQCGLINFREKKGIECVAIRVEKMLHTLREKHKEYGIKEDPYVFVKADTGTYGMGIMTLRSGDEIYEMNKRTRNKMNVIKEGTQNTEVIIQEGIPTIDKINNSTAEPLMYLVDGEVAGGMMRINGARDPYQSLNTMEMHFESIPENAPNLKAFSLIARLAKLATAREDYSHKKDGCEEKPTESNHVSL